MAEYKGLTIRIGGDTSQLNSALKASTKSAASLQREIRQITRAMRFDPTDLKNVDTRMRLTTNRAESLYSKMRLLKSAYGELGDTVVSVGGSATSVRKLSESTENIALAASAAKERYNDMTKNLAANYRELEARAKAAGKSMNLNALSRQGSDDTFERQMARLRELGVITDEEIQKLREMRAVWGEAFDSSEAYKAASQLVGMAVDMQRFESEARNAAATVRELFRDAVTRQLDSDVPLAVLLSGGLDSSAITDAGYELKNALPCIYVEAAGEDGSSLSRYWVSVDSGLLVAAETLQEGETTYRMWETAIDLAPALTDEFTLPDGTKLNS